MRDIEVANLASKFSDCKFKLGDVEGKEGWDCLSSIHDFYQSMGFDFPQEFKGFNAQNYAEKWSKGEGRQEFKEFLLSLGNPVERNYMIRGDLTIWENSNAIFPAIYLGKNEICAIFEIGGRVCKMKHLEAFVKLIGIRRLI